MTPVLSFKIVLEAEEKAKGHKILRKGLYEKYVYFADTLWFPEPSWKESWDPFTTC